MYTYAYKGIWLILYVQQIQAKQEIELLTAEAWFSENKELETKVISIHCLIVEL